MQAVALATPFNDENQQTNSTARDAVIWHLLVMEETSDTELTTGYRITGQFTPTNPTHNMGNILSEAGGYSRSQPLLQWIGGALETFTFEARLFSEHSKDNTTRDKLEVLKFLTQPCQPMGRPPLTRFFWGNAIPGGMPCFVDSLGNIRYDEIRPDGSLRGATLNITVKKFIPFTIARANTSPVERTPTHVVKTGETYEMIAYRTWGDPMLGVPLRQQNPRYPMEKWAPKQLADLSNGETIKLFPRRDLDRDKIRPQCHIFNPDDPASADLRRFYFMTLAKKTGIIIKR